VTTAYTKLHVTTYISTGRLASQHPPLTSSRIRAPWTMSSSPSSPMGECSFSSSFSFRGRWSRQVESQFISDRSSLHNSSTSIVRHGKKGGKWVEADALPLGLFLSCPTLSLLSPCPTVTCLLDRQPAGIDQCPRFPRCCRRRRCHCPWSRRRVLLPFLVLPLHRCILPC